MTIREVPQVRRGGDLAPGLTGYWNRPLPVDRFARLTQDMHRAIVAHAGRPDASDALLETVLGQAVEIFLSRAGHPVAAALQMAPLMRQIGAREASIGHSFGVLDTSMRIARSAAGAYLPRLLAAHPLTPARAEAIREDLGIFLEQLREHARVGYDRQWSMEEMSPEDADLALRRMLFDAQAVLDPARLLLLAQRAGRTLPEQVQPLVSVDGPLPRELLDDPRVLAGLRPDEALVYDSLSASMTSRYAIALTPSHMLVVGSHSDLVDGTRSLGVARRAASMVAAGLLPRSEQPLRCETVLGRIATATDPYLLDLMATRHLAPLEAMSPARRLDLAELLVEWLETGAAVNELARRSGQHTQTLHSRMRTLRLLLGEDRLSQPDQRVELILALRHRLPGWRQQQPTPRRR